MKIKDSGEKQKTKRSINNYNAKKNKRFQTNKVLKT